MTTRITEIKKKREESEQREIICIREINDNIKRVMEGKPLTRPLSVLNKSCEFKKRYDVACDILEGDLDKIKRQEYRQRPEVKQKKKEYYEKNKEIIIKRSKKRYLDKINLI